MTDDKCEKMQRKNETKTVGDQTNDEAFHSLEAASEQKMFKTLPDDKTAKNYSKSTLSKSDKDKKK